MPTFMTHFRNMGREGLVGGISGLILGLICYTFSWINIDNLLLIVNKKYIITG
jgi:hypothetical protein